MSRRDSNHPCSHTRTIFGRLPDTFCARRASQAQHVVRQVHRKAAPLAACNGGAGARLVVEAAGEMRPQPGAVRKVG
jgi:hypothetical protein